MSDKVVRYQRTSQKTPDNVGADFNDCSSAIPFQFGAETTIYPDGRVVVADSFDLGFARKESAMLEREVKELEAIVDNFSDDQVQIEGQRPCIEEIGYENVGGQGQNYIRWDYKTFSIPLGVLRMRNLIRSVEDRVRLTPNW